MTTLTEVTTSLARLEEWARHAEATAQKADEDRQEMMKQLTLLTKNQENLLSDMKEVKPVTDMVSAVRNKLVGASLILGIIGTLLTSALLYFKDAISEIIWG